MLDDPLTRQIIGAAIEVHRILGPGLLESIYERALCQEFGAMRLAFQRQVPIDIVYKGVRLRGQRLDLIVENRVVVEIKSAPKMPPIALSQVLTYLKTTKYHRGLVINFGARRLVDGVKRVSL